MHLMSSYNVGFHVEITNFHLDTRFTAIMSSPISSAASQLPFVMDPERDNGPVGHDRGEQHLGEVGAASFQEVVEAISSLKI